MSGVWSKILVLSNALLLALPPGWCCTVSLASARPEKPKPVPARCCCCETEETPPTEPEPAQPPHTCCCEKQQAVTSKADPTAPLTAVTILVAPVADPLPVVAPAAVDELVLFSSPPLFVLQCVWRC